MFSSSNKSEYLSGYLKINESLQIEEFSGQINRILRHENLDLNMDILEIIHGLKKNLSYFFENEVYPSILENKIKHLVFKRKNSILTIAITPMSSGSTLLSFEENYQPEISIEQSLPDQLQEILIRVNTDMQVDRKSVV